MATEKRLIDASWILGEIEHDLGCYEIDKLTEDDVLYVEIRDVVKMVCAAPTVDAVEVVHSRFVHIADFGDGEGCFGYCERCGSIHHAQHPIALKADYRWCRWCGAKMDGDGNG